MPKGKTSKPVTGHKIQVNEGVSMPEFPDLDISGWTGVVIAVSGSGAKMQVTLEWDAATQAELPASYVQHCEAQQLLATMACLPVKDVSPLEN